MAEDINKDMEECCKARDEYLAGWKRAKADFINYKRDELERIGKIVRYASEELILKILPIMDNFERAEAGASDSIKDDQHFKGLLQVKVQIKDLLKTFEVEEISAQDKEFDPNFHEVVAEIDGNEPGKIKEIVQKGYIMQEKVIRPAKVKIIKH